MTVIIMERRTSWRGTELSVSRSDLSTFSVIYFLPRSRAREPSNLCPGTMTRRLGNLYFDSLPPRGPHQYFKVRARSPDSWLHVDTVPRHPDSHDSWPWPIRGQHFALLESYLERETFSQVSSLKWQWVSEKRQLSCTLPRSEIITFSLTTYKMSLVNYVFCFYWPGGILSTVLKNCFLENKINLSGII